MEDGEGQHPQVGWGPLKSNGFRINDWVVDILIKKTLAPVEAEIELVNVSVADLGFTTTARRCKSFSLANELGLDLVPAEVGPQLRLAYSNQPLGELMQMGIRPLTPKSNLRVFSVGHNDTGRWLPTEYGGPDRARDPRPPQK